MEKRMNIKNIYILALFTAMFMALTVPVTSFAKGVPPLVSTSWLDKHKGDKNVVLIDVRTEANYGFAHIPNAVSIPYSKLEPKCATECYKIPPLNKVTQLFQNAGVNNNSHVVVYAHGNTTSDASKAAAAYWILKAMGHKNVSMLNGGFTKWTFEGRVVTNKTPKVKKGNFQAKRNSAAIADFQEVAKVVQKGGAVLVDARNSVQYFGHEKRIDVTCYGHIPGAINFPADFLTNAGVNRAPATIKDTKDLATMAVGVGIPKAKSTPIIVYCNTAQLAGLNYLVLKDILGYHDVKVYDGSMLEYCKIRGKLPVERFSWSIGSLKNL